MKKLKLLQGEKYWKGENEFLIYMLVAYNFEIIFFVEVGLG